MLQTVQIDLATNTTTAYEHYSEIKKAVESASLGLYSKYDVQIKDVQAVGGHVIMHVAIPNEIASTFQIGYHLRGISAYLMRNYRDTYAPLIVAKKLLVYTVIPTQTDSDDNALTINDKLSAISDFVELLKSNDALSINKATRILEILREE